MGIFVIIGYFAVQQQRVYRSKATESSTSAECISQNYSNSGPMVKLSWVGTTLTDKRYGIQGYAYGVRLSSSNQRDFGYLTNNRYLYLPVSETGDYSIRPNTTYTWKVVLEATDNAPEVLWKTGTPFKCPSTSVKKSPVEDKDKPCKDRGGVCQNDSKTCRGGDGHYRSGLCLTKPNDVNYRCCLPGSEDNNRAPEQDDRDQANKKTITVKITGRGRVTDKEGKINCTTRGEGVKHCEKTVNYNGGYELHAASASGFIFKKWTPEKWCNAPKTTKCKSSEVKEDRTITAIFEE